MSQQMNMGGMVGMGGMGNMAGMGGPGAPSGQGLSNTGTPSSAPVTHKDVRTKFHTFIYDYFLKTQRYDLARAVLNQMDIDTSAQSKPSPNRKEVNGIDDSTDVDSKDDMKKPDDLPPAQVPMPDGSAFLYDWFCQFWDLYDAQRSKGSPATRNYLMSAQQRVLNERRMRTDPQMQANMGAMRNGMLPNGMPGMPNDMARKMMMQARGNITPQQMQLQQHHQQQARMHQMLQQQQQQQQTQMQREGSAIDINGQQRPSSPASGDAPSPKRQRLEGSFNGAPIGAMGRGQGQTMPGQQFNGAEMMDLANSPAKSMQQQVEYSQGLHQHLTNALKSNMNKGIAGSAPPMAQGSPPLDPDFLNGMNRGPAGQPNGANSNSNHALQDYQMQLMLLEQQNKKRLLMARQEQDNMTNGPGGPGPGPGQQGAFPQPMSPQGSRTGLSPNPVDQMKRGTPKMAPGAVPSPNADVSMPQGRASPAPGFDPSQMNPNMPQNMFPQMKQMGMLGPNGQMMPPSSHPMATGPINPQQLEMLRHAQQNGGRMPNGFMPQGPPQMMPAQQPGGPMQHAPNMTPQQRNAAMPPPPAPIGDIARGPQPTSPQAQPAPPTPSQGNKPNTKGKKEKSNKKANNKKGAAGATPASEAEQPPTPTPAPPITPTSTQTFPPKNGLPAQPAQNPLSQPQNQPDLGGGPFGNLDSGDFSSMNLDFGNLEGPDVLDNFDFDSFLNNDSGDAFGFGADMGFGDNGLEAGGDV